MSSAAPPPITPKQLAGLSPEMQVLIGAIIDHYERRIAALEAEVKALKKTPQNSTVMSNSRAARFAASAGEACSAEGEVETEARRAAGACPMRAAADSLRAV